MSILYDEVVLGHLQAATLDEAVRIAVYELVEVLCGYAVTSQNPVSCHRVASAGSRRLCGPTLSRHHSPLVKLAGCQCEATAGAPPALLPLNLRPAGVGKRRLCGAPTAARKKPVRVADRKSRPRVGARTPLRAAPSAGGKRRSAGAAHRYRPADHAVL